MVLVLISRGRAPRTDLIRAAAILFGGWMLVDGLILSYMKTMVHPYYCLSFVPAVAGMFAIGVHEMWCKRESWFGRGGLVAMIGGTGVWSWWILGTQRRLAPGTALGDPGRNGGRRGRPPGVVDFRSAPTVCGGVAGGAGPDRRPAGRRAYAFATIGQSHDGGMAVVGPP